MAVIWTYLRRYRWFCLTAVIFVLLETNCELLLPTLMSSLIDDGVRQGDLARILTLGGEMALAALAGIVCILIRNLCTGMASQKFGADLRRGLFAHLLGLTEESADQVGDGSLVTRMMNDCDQLSKSVNSALRIGVKSPALCVGSVLYALRLDAGLSLAVLAVTAVVLALIAVYMRLSDQRFQRVRLAMDRINTVVQEFLRGVRLIKALGREEDEHARFQEVNDELTEAGVRLQVLSAWFSPLVTLVVNLGVVLVLWLAGAWSVEAGKVSALVTYLTQMLTSLMTLIDVFKLTVRANTSAKRIQEVLDLPVEVEPEHPERPDDSGPVLAFRDVTFAYPGGSGVAALRNVSFTLDRGETLAVVGPTGAGKSTLAWLCARLYDPQLGEIILGGRNLRNLPVGEVRERVSVAPQQGVLFSGTVRKNLAMGAPESDNEVLEAALETAQADSFVEAAGGLDASLEQGGVNLSGGQRQRLSLARALARNGDVLVLDDCTSALDTVTEKQVLDALWNRPDQAVVLITQRVRNVSQADQILVLEDGRVLGLGDHQTLLKTCPTYQEIWAVQAPEEGESHGRQ